jgi:hypothetical protein
MTDKELQKWEEEAKEADQDLKKLIIGVIIIGLGILLLYITSLI